VRETGSGLRFAQEPLAKFGDGRELLREHLQGDRTIQLYVACQVDCAHAATAEQSLQVVLAAERSAQCVERRFGGTHGAGA